MASVAPLMLQATGRDQSSYLWTPPWPVNPQFARRVFASLAIVPSDATVSTFTFRATSATLLYTVTEVNGVSLLVYNLNALTLGFVQNPCPITLSLSKVADVYIRVYVINDDIIDTPLNTLAVL